METFKKDLDKSLSNRNVHEYTYFQNLFVYIHLSIRANQEKIMGFNNNSFMTTALRKTRIYKSKFKNVYHKS